MYEIQEKGYVCYAIGKKSVHKIFNGREQTDE